LFPSSALECPLICCCFPITHVERVDQLVLISPAGVPDKPPASWEERKKKQSFSTRMVFTMFQALFDSQYTPGTILRALPEQRSMAMVENYINKRLPAITDPDEQKTLAEYLYFNAMLPGSAEHCVSRLLTSPFLIAKEPLLHRIPSLKVPRVSFLYGSHDWMDFTGGLKTQLRSEELRERGNPAPTVGVYRINQAGHLVMLDNWRGFNAGIIEACGGSVGENVKLDDISMPIKLCPMADMPSFVNSELSRAPSATTPAAAAQ